MSSNDPRLPARAIDGAHFSTVDEDGSVREWVRFRGAWVPLLVDADTFERIATGAHELLVADVAQVLDIDAGLRDVLGRRTT